MKEAPRMPVVRLEGINTSPRGLQPDCNGLPLNCNGNAPEVEEAIICRMAVEAPLTASGKLMFMPAGIHQITPSQGGKVVRVNVSVTPESAAAIEAQRQAIVAKGKRPYFDFDHEDGKASFWPDAFRWEDAPDPGVYAHGEWSASGKQAIEGKDYRQFSPTFFVDNTTANPARVIAQPGAKPNMGGLVNDPAFHAIKPFFAKTAEATAGAQNQSSTSGNNTVIMTPEQLAALQASIKNLETEVIGLRAKAGSDAEAATALKAKETELKLAKAEEHSAALEAKNVALEAADKARRESDATNAVRDAIARGAIAAKDEAGISQWKELITVNPANAALLAKMPGASALSGRITPAAATLGVGEIRMGAEAPKVILLALGALTAKNAKMHPEREGVAAFGEKGLIAREVAHIFAREIMARDKEFLDMPLSLLAADYTDPANNLGTLSGTLVIMRTLQLFKLMFPAIGAIATDFSDQPGLFKQTEMTRIVGVPAVQTYNTTLDATGRPKGWDVASAAVTTDVPITLDEHVGIPIVFDSNILATTMRRLFDESAPAVAYALAKYFINKIYHLLTPANFNAYIATSGSKIPVAYVQYVVAQADFRRASLSDLCTILNPNEVPLNERFVLLNSPYYNQLANDPTLVTFRSEPVTAGYITDNVVPRMSTFNPIEAPNLIDNNATPNLIGFAGQKNALLAKTRLPNDYTSVLPGASYGNVSTVTLPETSMSVMLVEYVNHTGGYAERRMQVMLGAAVGDKRAGLCMTSQ